MFHYIPDRCDILKNTGEPRCRAAEPSIWAAFLLEDGNEITALAEMRTSADRSLAETQPE